MDPCRLHEDARYPVESVQRIDDHGNHREHEADQDLRRVAEAEQDDEQRIERIDRDCVIGREQRLQNLPQRVTAVQPDTEGDPDDHRQTASDGDIHEGLEPVSYTHLIRTLDPQRLPEPPDFATIDVSFISLKLALPAVGKLLAPRAQLLALIKPQFEASRSHLKKGIVRNESVHKAICEDIGASIESRCV